MTRMATQAERFDHDRDLRKHDTAQDSIITETQDDGLDSDGYPRDQPREWSDEELSELRRREFATDNYGRDI